MLYVLSSDKTLSTLQKKKGHKTVYETVWNIGICTENNEVQVAKFLDQMYKFRPSVEQELKFSKEILLL